MMPPTAKHTPVNLMAHLRHAVTAHKAVQEGIATHAEKERVKREAHLVKLQADTGLIPQPVTPRVPLRAHSPERRDEHVRLLGGHLEHGPGVAPPRDLY